MKRVLHFMRNPKLAHILLNFMRNPKLAHILVICTRNIIVYELLFDTLAKIVC